MTVFGKLFYAALGVMVLAAPAPAADAPIDRTVLPIQAPTRPRYTALDARTGTPPPRFDVTAPAGAPNVIIV